MKVEKNGKYFTIAVYTVCTVITIIVITFLLFRIRIVGGYLAKWLGGLFTLLLPLIFGLMIAYLMDPLVGFYADKCVPIEWRFHRKGKARSEDGRGFATTLAFITFIAFIGLVVLLISFNVQDVMGALKEQKLTETFQSYFKSFEDMLENVDQMANTIPFLEGNIEIVGKIYGWLEQFLASLGDKMIAFITNLGTQLFSLALGFVIAFYALKDKKKLLVIWRRFVALIVPRRIQSEVMDIGRDVDYVFSGYIRGQIIDAVIMATLISIALTLIRLDFAIIIGIISGIFNLIPYFGPIVGFVLAGLVGFISGEPQKGIYAVIAVMALQQLDGWVIVPKVMGETVKLHPIVVLLVIIVGGQLFGLVGFLLAVPVTGFIRLLIIRYMGDVFNGKEN